MSAREAKRSKLQLSSASNPSNHEILYLQQQHGSNNQEIEEAPTFYNEISNVMRGFGDCTTPLYGSIKLVEKILKQQLKGILNEVFEIATRRKGEPNPTQDDFEFLMRKHPVRIMRLRKYIKLQNGCLTLLAQQNYQDNTELKTNQESDESSEIEIIEKFDEEKTRRLFRADRITQTINSAQYKEYFEARRTSFYCRNSDKMKQDLRRFLNLTPDIKLSPECLNILSYLANETIATIVDFAILTRLNSDNRITDPFSRITTSGATPDIINLCPEVTQGRGLDGIKPITVQEIQEGIRRFNQFTNKSPGFYRNTADNYKKKCFLAV